MAKHPPIIDPRTTQVRAKPRKTVRGNNPGTMFWLTPADADNLVALGAVEIVGTRDQLGSDHSLNPKGPAEKKSSDAPMPGPMIGSASLMQDGQKARLLSPAVGLASPTRTSHASALGNVRDAPSDVVSPSTTPI